MLKIYIASRYSNSRINRVIEERMKKEGWGVYLPEHSGYSINSEGGKPAVLNECIKQICGCNVIFVVGPHGNDVSFELGVAYGLATAGHKYLFIRWNTTEETSKTDDIIEPVFHKESLSLDEIINFMHDFILGNDI